MMGNFTIQNTNSYAVKDIQLDCKAVAASGTVLDVMSHTVYDTIPANGSKRFKEVNLGFINSQARRGGCTITGALKF